MGTEVKLLLVGVLELLFELNLKFLKGRLVSNALSPMGHCSSAVHSQLVPTMNGIILDGPY